MSDHHFFLGGNDLEMEAIRDLLRHAHVPTERIHDRHLAWGARASDYADDIHALPHGATPVLVELENDLLLADALVLDHHGERAGKAQPTVLEQLWSLLGMPDGAWGRNAFADFPLIVANDRGYIPAMRALGASDEKIAEIRARDRAAQGITPEQERQAEEALRHKQVDLQGELVQVELPHDRIAPVTDRLALGEGYRNLLIVSPGEINFSGDGYLVKRLNQDFPGGWYGGALPDSGYWGIARGRVDPGVVQDLLTRLTHQTVALD